MGTETVDEILSRHPEIQARNMDTMTLAFNLIGSYSKQEALTGMRPNDDELIK